MLIEKVIIGIDQTWVDRLSPIVASAKTTERRSKSTEQDCIEKSAFVVRFLPDVW